MKTLKPCDILEIANQYNITLNGVNAEVYPFDNGVMINNNDFSDPDLEFDEIYLSNKDFKNALKSNNGTFTTNR